MQLHKIILRVIFISLFILCILLTVRFCSLAIFTGKSSVKGDGNIKRSEIKTGYFNKVNTSGSLDVFIRQGSEASVQIVADSNLLEYINAEVDDNTLIIKHTKRISLTRPAKIMITVPDLDLIRVNGASSINITDTFRTRDLTINIRGAGNAYGFVESEYLKAAISGAGEMTLLGRSVNSEMSVKGAGKINASSFYVDDLKVKIQGAGDATVHAVNTLDASIYGTGKIEYSGNPHLTEKIKGIGRIVKY